MTAPATLPVVPSASDDASGAALRQAATRAELRSAQAMCRGLRALLPDGEPWRGPASVAYRLRVAVLRERVDAACAALAAAEAAL